MGKAIRWGRTIRKEARNMKHGAHDNCLMCRMARATGMTKKHPKSCDCQEKKGKEEKKEIEANL